MSSAKPLLVLNLDSFQNLAGVNKPSSMCDLIGCLRLLNENMKYISGCIEDFRNVEEKTFYFGVMEHLSQDKEFIEQQMAHNISTRKKESVERKEQEEKALDGVEWKRKEQK